MVLTRVSNVSVLCSSMLLMLYFMENKFLFASFFSSHIQQCDRVMYTRLVGLREPQRCGCTLDQISCCCMDSIWIWTRYKYFWKKPLEFCLKFQLILSVSVKLQVNYPFMMHWHGIEQATCHYNINYIEIYLMKYRNARTHDKWSNN